MPAAAAPRRTPASGGSSGRSTASGEVAMAISFPFDVSPGAFPQRCIPRGCIPRGGFAPVFLLGISVEGACPADSSRGVACECRPVCAGAPASGLGGGGWLGGVGGARARAAEVEFLYRHLGSGLGHRLLDTLLDHLLAQPVACVLE